MPNPRHPSFQHTFLSGSKLWAPSLPRSHSEVCQTLSFPFLEGRWGLGRRLAYPIRLGITYLGHHCTTLEGHAYTLRHSPVETPVLLMPRKHQLSAVPAQIGKQKLKKNIARGTQATAATPKHPSQQKHTANRNSLLCFPEHLQFPKYVQQDLSIQHHLPPPFFFQFSST